VVTMAPPAVDPATEYALDILREPGDDRRIVAGPFVRAAMRRHFGDLELARFDAAWRASGSLTPTPVDDDGNPAREFPWRWDWPRAQRVIDFFALVQFYEGDFAGEPFTLLPYQLWLTGSIFGWVHPETGLRRFQNVYVEIGKGNGKTPWAAVIGLYMMMADGEEGAQVYSAASGLDQAKLCFNDANSFAEASPTLSRHLIIDKTNIAYPRRHAFFRPISGTVRGKSGPRPSCAIVDEMHELLNPKVLSILRRGFKFRTQPLFIGTTNSGEGSKGICWEYHQKAIKVAQAALIDDRWLAYVCALDAPSEWTDETCWPKTMPAIGSIVSYDAVREQVRDGLDVPMHQNDVKRLYFCIWTATKTLWLDMEKWAKCVVSPKRFREILREASGATDDVTLVSAMPGIRRLRCFGGTDLSSTIALTAAVFGWRLGDWTPQASESAEDDAPAAGAVVHRPAAFLDPLLVAGSVEEIDERIIDAELDLAEDAAAFEEEREGMRRLREVGYIAVRASFFLPEDEIEERERRDGLPYLQWANDGHLTLTPGPVVDYGFLREYLDRSITAFDPRGIGFDKHNAIQTMTEMMNDGEPVVDIAQSYTMLSDPCKQLERMVRAGYIIIEGNPILTLHAANAATKRDPRANIMPDKSDERTFIDGISALVTMLALLLRDGGESDVDYSIDYVDLDL